MRAGQTYLALIISGLVAGCASPKSAVTTEDAAASSDDAHSGDGSIHPSDAGLDATGTTDAGQFVTLRNAAPGCGDDVVAPDPGNEGHWSATRITPPSYPFDVYGVSYFLDFTGLVAGGTCNSGLAHQVELFIGTAATPVATPVPIATTTITATANTTSTRKVTWTLAAPVTLTTGQSLFVSVQMVGGSQKDLCLIKCSSTPNAADRNWWSSATTAPFPWASLASFGSPGTVVIETFGR